MEAYSDQHELQEIESSSSSSSTSRTNSRSSISGSGSNNSTSSSPGESGFDSNEKKSEEEENYTEVGFWGNLFNLLNCMLGAGILSIPSTFNDSGIVVSFIIMIIVAVITHYATVITLTLQHKTGAKGFDDLAMMILGKFGSWSLSAMIIIFNMGANLAYLILGVDFITSWFAFADIDVSSSLYRAIITFIYGLILPISLSIPRSLNFLGYISTICVFFIFFYIIAIFVKFGIFVHEGNPVGENLLIAKGDIKLFSSISIYATAFSLPVCILPLIWQYTPNLKKRNFSSFLSLTIVFTVTALPSVFAYLMFGQNCEGNILKTWPDKDVLMTIVRVGFFLIVTVSFPITHPAIACSFSAVIFKENHATALVGWRRALVLVLSNGIPLIIGMFLPEMKPALEVAGALGGCLGNFLLPGIMWFLTSTEKKTHWTNILVILLAIFGVVSAVISTWIAIESAIDAFKTVSF
ncbi:Transmembrane amino acid transporter protein [Tritrichomonas foetus]|uniref:Transmembrane amino acid transporter protein n=1 Tax=Tritrichomonas foetus TaxID=1144522 RepID=A0A1J4JTF0_9EUKA|nr:Transmembrane amino acid transporter protein [Tritrichomonas foetus]|eukprot:OHT02401.1 Transmembrane amino acid transporter protein [Tritrichomonas foetus]